MPTATLEEYLETIYKLSQDGPAKPTQIAEEIGVSGPTVTNTLKRLEAAGLVRREGTDVLLTDEGRAHSLDIVRRHRIAERFLVDVLGIDWHDVHEDACLLEHALSPRVLAALEVYLDNPEVCPHGHPIPAADGTVRTVAGVALSTVSAGSDVVVVQVAENDEAVLAYLQEVGLKPGAGVRVVEVAPFGGPLLVEVGERQLPLAREIAALVLVAASA
jgi:DtxR family Mn-dependent transcriptional regulator